MKIFPYATTDGIIQTVELAELEKVKLAAIGLEAECAGLRADIQECNERLTKQQADMLDTIVQLRVELTSWQSMAERLASALKDCKSRAMDKSIKTHAGDHAKGCIDDIWEWSEQALAAYESATKGSPQMFTSCESCEATLVCSDLGNCYAEKGNISNLLAEAVKRMEAVPCPPSAFTGAQWAFAKRKFISAAKGEQP